MNNKLNTVFDIINATNTVSANRYLSHALGAEVAIIYNALLAKYAYYNKHDMIPDDWFYSTIDDLWRSTALSEKTQKRAIAILVKEGLIECKRKGMPAKRSFFICNAYDKIVALIEKGKEILGENTAETAKSKTIEGDSAVQLKRQNKNSRKSATSYAVSAEHTYKTKENNQKLYKHQQKTVADVMQTAMDKGTYYHGEYKTPGEVSEAVGCIDENGMQYITDCCEKHRSKINNLKAYITSLVFSLAESCKITVRTQFEESTNSSFDVYKLDQWALEQYAQAFKACRKKKVFCRLKHKLNQRLKENMQC